MNNLKFPTAKEADICLILEGTFPFVGGGVSHWARELIRFFPEYSFAVIFLGTKKEDYKGYHSTLLDNVVHLEAHYLFEDNLPPKHIAKDISAETRKKIESMHDKFVTFVSDNSDTMLELFELMGDSEQINECLFLRSKTSWEILIDKYNKQYSDQSFFDFFWGIRSLHRPFWSLNKIVTNLPKVKILHSASTGYAGFLGALMQKKYSLPFVITEHGIYTKERWIELMRNYFFEYIVQEKKQFNIERGLLDVWTNFFTVLAKIAYRSADPIISLIDIYRERQIADGAEPKKTRIISYGVDFERYKFLDLKLDEENPIIAYVGRVVPIKDFKTFIRASALIINKIPKAEAWIIGSIEEDEEYVASCKDLVAILGLKNKIKFLGEHPMMEMYPKIDLLVMSSISEGSPFVILESFAVGLPVVATDVGGCRELIEGKNPEDKALGKAGRIVSLGNAEGLAEASIELLTSKTAWEEAKQTAVTRVRKYYSMEQLKENYQSIYERAISNGRNRV